MKKEKKGISQDVLEYQPDAVEIEERPIPGKVRWVLYVILTALTAAVVGAIIFQVDRIVVSEGRLITTSPTIVVQPLNTAIIRSIEARVGDVVQKGQVLATLDSTFASADLSQLKKRRLALEAKARRIEAELQDKPFSALPEEEVDGRLQEQLYRQRKIIFERNKTTSSEKIAALQAKKSLNMVQRQGLERQLLVLRDVEGTTAKLPQNGTDYRLRLLEAQRSRNQAINEIESLTAEEEVIIHELEQARSEWSRFIEERTGDLMEQAVQLRTELEDTTEEINKAKRLHDLVSLRAPEEGIVLDMVDRSVGSIIQQAEPFITLVPLSSTIEAEVNVKSKDIARIRTGDSVRIKLDAFPFQKHDTLPGEVRVISENSFQTANTGMPDVHSSKQEVAEAFYRARIRLLSLQLRNVPAGFRLLPGMRVRAEIKVGQRSVISYFLYPIIRVFDESLREP